MASEIACALPPLCNVTVRRVRFRREATRRVPGIAPGPPNTFPVGS